MLEQETERIIVNLTDRTIAHREQITLHEALACRIPEGIKAYLRAEVLRLLEDDLWQTRRFPPILTGNADSAAAVRAFLRSVALEYVFTRPEFVATVDQAVHFLGNYVCRPQWTLHQFAFNQGDPISVASLEVRLEYVTDYSYMTGLITGYCRRKQWREISSSQFQSLLARIDHAVVRRSSWTELARLARPVFDFFFLSGTDADTAPVKALLVFFADKDLEVVREYVERACQLRNLERISMSQLADILKELDMMEHLQPEEAPAEEKPTGVPAEAGDRAAGSAGETAPEGPPISAEITPDAEAPPPPAAEGGEIRHDPRNIALAMTFAGMKENPPDATLPSLTSIIASEDQALFLRNIFDDDPEFYAGIIDMLDHITSREEAQSRLRNLFESRGIDPASDAALRFSAAVGARFRPENG